MKTDFGVMVLAGLITVLVELDEVIKSGHHFVYRVFLSSLLKLENLEIARRLPKIFGSSQIGLVRRIDRAVGFTLAVIVASLVRN